MLLCYGGQLPHLPFLTIRHSSSSLVMATPSQTLHWAQTISNTTWGHQLSFHPFTRGDAPVQFSSLWPDKSILVATYKEANLGRCVYDLCKLLLVTNSDRSLDALLEDHVSCCCVPL